MKSRMTKVAAVALAATMCVPAPVLATSTTATTTDKASGSFTTSFDLYSPKLTISVPVNANIQVNPMADTSKTVKKFTVASNSLDIINASVDADADAAIPVNVMVSATLSNKAEGVLTNYNSFTPSNTDTRKKVYLNVSQANTAATVAAKTGETLAFDGDKKLQLNQFAVNKEAEYDAVTNAATITKYGSLFSMDVAGPSTTDTTAGATFSTDATKVTPAVGSFAVTGDANIAADWKADDVTVGITYAIKASKPLSITTPTIATAPTFTSTGSADLAITVPSVGEATVAAIGVHNDGAGLYGDYIWEDGDYTVAYASGSATITIPKADGGLAFLAGDGYKGEAQDLVIALSDGRIVVSTLTVN